MTDRSHYLDDFMRGVAATAPLPVDDTVFGDDAPAIGALSTDRPIRVVAAAVTTEGQFESRRESGRPRAAWAAAMDIAGKQPGTSMDIHPISKRWA